MQFNAGDVIKVAKALLDDAVYWDHGYPNAMCARDGFACKYCCAKEYENRSDLKHDLDCPVLAAQDILTGA